ncbi:MAG: pyruvate ferredoxin oxidoreductase [Sulfolobales archaeon]|nr:pyruvate ferredoxin oxidoreductase [Sulfolobales archaeon]MCX8198558.1 pyruvate ferredoxin oxidoreductase [Sulfolobales archaeon]MDW8169631.1 transketolase C-terminal domain-containing protein [Desulfurococcaceae archaeon]
MVLKSLTGNYAVALAVKMARVDVVAAYPITPQTTIVEKLAEYIDGGELDAIMIRVESEHSALAAAYGSALAGARAFTATSSHGLLYMYEWVNWVSRARVPLVMAIVTRTIGPPWNIWTDHSDYYEQRDTGWIQGFAMDSQEVFDMTLQAFKISEDPRVYLPVMIGLDAFILSHTSMPVEVPEQELVDEWLGARTQGFIIDGSEALIHGALSSPEYTEEFIKDMGKAMEEAVEVIREVDYSFGRTFGRSYGGLVELYKCSDAKYHLVLMGAWAGDAMEAVDTLREQGYSIGVVRVRYTRPFPGEELYKALSSSKGVIVVERGVSFGSMGPMFLDIAGNMLKYSRKLPYMRNVIAGVGGVNVTYKDFEYIAKETIDYIESGEEPSVMTWYHARRSK